MQTLTLRASAKLNLTLAVGERMPDGYHPIRSVMQKISLFDTLEFTRSEETRMVSDLSYLPSDERNLCVRAVNEYRRLTGKDANLSIRVQKKIPVGAGLGGGSADAAATIRALEAFFGVLDEDTRQRLARSLGADVPFCLHSCNTALCEGVGERITPVENRIKNAHLLLYKEGRKASTARVYAAFDALDPVSSDPTDAVIGALERGDADALCDRLFNDLTRALESLGQPVGAIRKRMTDLGARGALMSGAGPTVYGVFTDVNALERARAKLSGSPDAFCAPAHFLL